MKTLFECVNCGRVYAADKLRKCPVCSASGPMTLSEPSGVQAMLPTSQILSSEEKGRKYEEQRRKSNEPSRGSLGDWARILIWLIGLCVVVFLILGWSGVFNSGSVDVECYDIQLANGDWGNSCDMLGEG